MPGWFWIVLAVSIVGELLTVWIVLQRVRARQGGLADLDFGAIRELSGKNAGPTGPAPLIAPMPGLIVRVNAQPGDQVQAGQGLVVMEAMKMENELRAPAAGRVKAVLAGPGTAVEKGAVLVELE